jgi:hypothetical protein
VEGEANGSGGINKRAGREAVNTWSEKSREARKDEETKRTPTEEAAKKAEAPHPSRPASPESAPTETKEKAKEIFGAAKKLSANVAATVKGAEKKGPPEMPMIPKRASGDAKKRTVTFGWNKGGNNEVDEVYMKFNCGYVTCTKKTVNIDAKLGKFTVDGIDADAYVDIILNGIKNDRKQTQSYFVHRNERGGLLFLVQNPATDCVH